MFRVADRARWVGVAAGAVVAVVAATTLAGCGSGDSTVAKTPTTTVVGEVENTPAAPSEPTEAPPAETPAVDPCAVDLTAPAIAKAVSELPNDPRSHQPWNPEPLAGNYNECAQLSAVIVAANTNAEHPNTRAVLFHLGKFIPQGVPDTYGFTGIDPTQSTGDTVALTYPTGIAGLDSMVKFRWNGTAVELISNAAG